MAELPAALAALPLLRQAATVTRLTGGPVSDKWRVELPGRAVTVRRDRPLAAALGLSRDRELACLRALAKAGWQPAPLFADPAGGVLVMPFLPGASWTAVDYADSGQLGRLGALLAALHRLPAAAPPVRLASAVRRYANVIGDDEAAQCAKTALLELAAAEPGPACFCHNDVGGGNVIQQDGGLRLIDWEYAGTGNPAFDVAAVIEQNALGATQSADFLKAYADCGGPDVARELARWRFIYRLTAGLWSRATGA